MTAAAPLVLALSPWIFYGGLNAADLASTAVGEHRGGREANPIIGRSWPRRVAVKAAETAVESWVDRRWGRKGRIIQRAAIGSFQAYLVVRNLRHRR